MRFLKILVLVGSLRKSNTYNTVRKIEDIHKKKSVCEYEYIFLKDIDLKQCRGCFACISKGEGYCPLKDDRDLIVHKIEAADGVILASPNYAANVSWLMKNCIDRFAYTSHRPKYFNQKFMLLISSGSYMGAKNAMKSLSMMVSGGSIISRLITVNSLQMNEKKLRIQEDKIKRTAKKFAELMSKEKSHSPPLSYLIWFSVFKASSGTYKESLPADYQYYMNKEYFIECKLNVFQKFAIKISTSLFQLMIKIGLV